MVRWIVTGREGQLGQCLLRRLSSEGERSVVALARSDLDLSDAVAIGAFFDSLEPSDAQETVVLNAAAYTAVDRCEEEEALATRVNGDAPAQIARRCKQAGFGLVHVSTDYVFDGTATTPYCVDAPTAPKSAYGRSKLVGEEAVLAESPDFLVVRTSWVFGPGRNFVVAIQNQGALRRSGEASGPLRVVADQQGSPTYSDDLAAGLLALRSAGASGLHQLTNSGVTTWWGFARAILDESGYRDLDIDRLATSDLNLAAPRPAYSVLDGSRAAALGVTLRPWREALVDYLATLDASDAVATA
jgi:dTDP-4-dehydrorhamnose reductase